MGKAIVIGAVGLVVIGLGFVAAVGIKAALVMFLGRKKKK